MLKFLLLLFCSETIQFIVFCYPVQMHRIIGSDFNDAIFCLYKLHLLKFSKLYQIFEVTKCLSKVMILNILSSSCPKR